MLFSANLLALCWALVGAALAVEDKCPKTEVACIDVMNSSQCIEQIVLEHFQPLTAAALVKCVEYEGTASSLPGATKLCRCSGCHSAPINEAIDNLFPPPCG